VRHNETKPGKGILREAKAQFLKPGAQHDLAFVTAMLRDETGG
jgi:hypothetical protein